MDIQIPPHVQQTWLIAGAEAEKAALQHSRPSAVFRPGLSLDGDKWCALYGADLQRGVAGFGDTPDEAMRAFDKAWAVATPLERAP